MILLIATKVVKFLTWGEKVKFKVFLFILLGSCALSQMLYISPAMDLALSVYEPFHISEPTRPGEIGLFRVANAASTIQIVSFEVGANVTLEALAVSTKQQTMNERTTGFVKIANVNCFYRWFSVQVSDKLVQAFQLMFLRFNKAYVMSYFAPEEEFHKYLVPALLTICSLKGQTRFNCADEKYGYKMMIYEPFKPAEVGEGEIGAFAAVYGAKVGYVQIVQEKLPRKMKVVEYAQLVEKNTLSKLEQCRILSSGQNLVEGNEFFWRIFSFTSDKAILKALQAHLVLNDLAITLTYLSSEQNFEQFLVPALATIFSFRM